MENLIGMLCMIKNEENSIAMTINSVKKYIKHVIVFDTGSTDKTIEIVKETCKNNNQILHLKSGIFKSFPESRNESIIFAETVSVKYLLMMDSGDEFQTNNSKKNFFKIIKTLPININYGLVKQNWLNGNDIEEHTDIRFIRNKSNCRYDVDNPVHESFKNVNNKFVNMSPIFILYQDRNKYGGSTISRFSKDIELLLKAPQTKRNLHMLAQSYMSIDDYENGFKYNLLSSETVDKEQVDKFTYVRLGYCAMMIKKPLDIIFKYLELAINRIDPPIDAYIYIFKVSIENNCIDKAVMYIEKLFNMKKPINESTLISNKFYDYTRYNLISIACLISGKYMDLGKQACLIAIKHSNLQNDLNNIKLF